MKNAICKRKDKEYRLQREKADNGKLKRGLRTWLDTVPYVERVTDAEQGDGGPGCSVVWVR